MAFGFFKRLLGGSEAATVRNDPPVSTAPAKALSIASEPPRAEPGLVVQRDEMIDARSRIAGYRFVAKRFDGGARLPAELAVTALGNDNLQAFAQRRQAVVSLGASDWFAADFSPFIGSNTTFFISTPSAGARDEWARAVSAIKASGGSVAIDGNGIDDSPVLPNLLMLDFAAYPLEAFERVVKGAQGRYPGLVVAVDGVGSWTEHRLCESLGVRYSLGGFAATPDAQVQGERLNQSRLVLMEMLNLLRRDGSPADIAAVAKRDPAVAVKILGMANSPMSGLTSPVASVERAMMVLGRDTLYRWLSLGMFRAGAADSRDETLLELALFRARFLELMATGSRPKAECDELFLVGLLSLVDNLLGLPMAEVVGKMHLPQAVGDVLLGNGGPHSRWLLLALAMEKGRTDRAAELTETLNLDRERLEESVSAARAWAEEALQNS